MKRSMVTLAGVLLFGCASAPPAPVKEKAPPPGPTTYERPPVPGPLDRAPRPEPPRRVAARLPNGLRVVVVQHHQRPVVVSRLVFGRGVGTERSSERGATYLAVTLLGDLYEEYDDGSRRVGEETLRAQIWYQGASLITHVGQDMSSIGIEGFSADIDVHLERLAKAVKRPRCGAAMFVARRSAIIHALEDIELSDDSTLYQVLERAAFGLDHPYARTIYGTQDSLRKLGHEQVLSRQEELLDPANTTLLVVGDVQAERVVARARAELSDWRRAKRPPRSAEEIPKPARASPRRVVRFIEQPTARLMTVCATQPVPDPSISDAALEVLASVVGGGLRGRLSMSLRGEAGLVYAADAFVVKKRHARAVLACTRVRAKHVEAGLARVVEVFRDAGRRAATAAELRRAKAMGAAAIRAEHEDLESIVATELGRLALGRRPPARARIAALEAVTGEEVRALAQRLFDPDRIQLVLAGKSRPARVAVARLGLGRVEPVSSVW